MGRQSTLKEAILECTREEIRRTLFELVGKHPDGRSRLITGIPCPQHLKDAPQGLQTQNSCIAHLHRQKSSHLHRSFNSRGVLNHLDKFKFACR